MSYGPDAHTRAELNSRTLHEVEDAFNSGKQLTLGRQHKFTRYLQFPRHFKASSRELSQAAQKRRAPRSPGLLALTLSCSGAIVPLLLDLCRELPSEQVSEEAKFPFVEPTPVPPILSGSIYRLFAFGSAADHVFTPTDVGRAVWAAGLTDPPAVSSQTGNRGRPAEGSCRF